jgi:DNA-binding transcriptional regulator YbjK
VSITPSGRARQVADAAITVLADHGARGLTHRAVDQAAGLPPGTTSNYARTRAALLTLILTRIAELDAADAANGADGLAGPEVGGRGRADADGAGLADRLARMLHRMITDTAARQRLLARFELAFEATRRPELRAAYDELGGRFRADAARLLAAAGSAEPDRDAWSLIAWMEGTAFYALAGAGGPAVPSAAALRAQAAGLLAGLCGDDPGAT